MPGFNMICRGILWLAQVIGLPLDEELEAVIHKNLEGQIEDVLKTLTPREERVLRLRFGIEDGYPHTQAEVGRQFDVTPERIRQIEDNAIRKLRHRTGA